MKLLPLIYICVSFCSLIFTLLTSFHLCLFLSSNQSGILLEQFIHIEDSLFCVVVNIFLILFFVTLHSLMATERCKYWFEEAYLLPIHRSIYNLSSSFALQMLMRYWMVVNLTPVWDYSQNHVVVLLCQLLHAIGWISIFSTIFILDFNEFAGLKQVQFYLNDLGCPLSGKTPSAQSLFNNMRHPVAFGALLVLWIVPLMSLDRLVLAAGFSLYLLHGNKLDNENYTYVAHMYAKKSHSLEDSSHE